VRRRTNHHLGGDIAARASSILDDELLAETFRQPLSNKAGNQISRTARRKANNQVNRPRRIVERPREMRRGRERRYGCGKVQEFATWKLHASAPNNEILAPTRRATGKRHSTEIGKSRQNLHPREPITTPEMPAACLSL